MWDYIQWLPMILLGMGIAWLLLALHRKAQEVDDQWDEEEKRQQRVKDLYPDQPSYEERMDVRYGRTEEDDDNG